MNFTVTKKNLLEALKTVSPAINKGSLLHILGYVHLSTETNNVLKIRATDLDLDITASCVGMNGGGATEITANFVELSKAVKSWPSKEIVFSSSDDWLDPDKEKWLLLQNNMFTIPVRGMNPADFPPKHEFLCKPMGLNIFDQVDQRVAPFVKNDKKLGYQGAMENIYLVSSNGEATAVATDGHSMSVLSFPIYSYPPHSGVAVPPQFVKSLSKSKGVDVVVEGGWIYGESPSSGISVAAKLWEGSYPQYDRVMKSNTQFTVTVSANELLEAANVVGFVVNQPESPDRTVGPCIFLWFARDHVYVVDSAKMKCVQEVKLKSSNVDVAEPVCMMFQVAFLQKVLKALGNQWVDVLFNDSEVGSVQFESHEYEHGSVESHKVVLMPVRMRNESWDSDPDISEAEKMKELCRERIAGKVVAV